jgi:hypothetical protein
VHPTIPETGILTFSLSLFNAWRSRRIKQWPTALRSANHAMTDHPRFQPPTGAPDQRRHRDFHGARQVDALFRLVDWWLRSDSQQPSWKLAWLAPIGRTFREGTMFRAILASILLMLPPSAASAEKFKIVVDGYQAGELAFSDVFPRIDADKRQRINELVDLLVGVEANPAAGKYVVVVIIGHADRQDNTVQFPTADARRASELKASETRTEDARSWLLDQVRARLLAMGAIVPADFDSARNIALAFRPAGAADLVHVVPANEGQRRNNRRVDFFVQTLPKD